MGHIEVVVVWETSDLYPSIISRKLDEWQKCALITPSPSMAIN